MSEAWLVQLIGFSAGLIVCLSALPRVVDIYRNPRIARGESLLRNCAMALGNLMWVTYGAIVGAPAIAIMCLVSSVLNASIVFSIIRVRRQIFS